MESPLPNPYAPPSAELYDAVPSGRLGPPDAGKGLRFLNYLIDVAAGQGVSWAVFTWIYKVQPDLDLGTVGSFLSGYVVFTCYYFANEICGGRGLSKSITGTRAVMADGSPLKARSALTRSLCRHIPFEAFSFLGSGPGGWHDTLTGTRVVNVRARPISIGSERTVIPMTGAFTPPGVIRPPQNPVSNDHPPKQDVY